VCVCVFVCECLCVYVCECVAGLDVQPLLGVMDWLSEQQRDCV